MRRGEWGAGKLKLGEVISAWEFMEVFRSDSGGGLPWVWAAERHPGGGLSMCKGCEAVLAGLKANPIKATHTGERGRRRGSHVDSPRGTNSSVMGTRSGLH